MPRAADDTAPERQRGVVRGFRFPEVLGLPAAAFGERGAAEPLPDAVGETETPEREGHGSGDLEDAVRAVPVDRKRLGVVQGQGASVVPE